MEEKYIEYANIIIKNLDLKPELNEILNQIEELKIKGRKLNKTIKNNEDRRWELANELGFVKTTKIKQGEINETITRGVINSIKKKDIENILK